MTWNKRAAAFAARGSFATILVWMAVDTLLRATGPEWLWTVVDLPFRLMCHRIPERVLSLGAIPLPVCSRCLGIWGGLSLGAALAWPVFSMTTLRFLVPIAGALMLAEVVTQDLGLHPVFHPTRLLSGILLAMPIGGAIGGFVVRELGPLRRAE